MRIFIFLAALQKKRQNTEGVIPNPVITTEMKTQGSAPVDHPFFEMDEPVILSVGRLSQEKDISTLIHAFKRVQQTIASRLIIIGDGPERDQLEATVNQEKMSQQASFLGHQDNPYSYYSKSDLFVLSSTREGLPTVLIEALSFGLKVVSTDCPSGPREILKDGRYGHLVPPKDSAALAEAIIQALKGSALKTPASELDKYTVETAVMSYKKVV
jgi:glycosyltransferase involved in cell wall biosynthesis